MKTIKLILFILMVADVASGQTLKQTVPEGSKVYVSGPTYIIVHAALNELSKWGYWQLAKSKEDADFIIAIIVDKHTYTDFDFSAEFSDHNNKVVYSTRPVNSVYPNGGVIKLIKKRMINEIEK